MHVAKERERERENSSRKGLEHTVCCVSWGNTSYARMSCGIPISRSLSRFVGARIILTCVCKGCWFESIHLSRTTHATRDCWVFGVSTRASCWEKAAKCPVALVFLWMDDPRRGVVQCNGSNHQKSPIREFVVHVVEPKKPPSLYYDESCNAASRFKSPAMEAAT